MKNNYKIVQELKEEEKQGMLFSSTKESSKNNTSNQNLGYTCFKNFFENAPIYGYMVSPEGTILEINKTVLTNLGYKKEELIGKYLTAIYAPESHEKMKTIFSKWKETGQIDNEEMVIATKQGEKRRVLLSASSVRGADGAILYSISVLKDVTDINIIYDELNKNLWLQKVKLYKLTETKKTFLKTISHELRTPITSIKGYVQLLMKKTLGEINEEQRKSLEVILRNTNRFDRVIQNILDASTLESGDMKFIPRKVNPRTLVEEITKTMEPFANKKEMTINVNLEKDLPELMIDGKLIKQVLMNLIDNAIKFSSDGSMIYVKARKENEDVLFEVHDFGLGIPKDKKGMIFDAFYQADSGDDRMFGGAGLSLALSKGIVRLHGGNIWFESTEGTGSTFLFTLPIQSIYYIDHTDLKDEMPSEKLSDKGAGLAVNSVTMNTTDEDESGSITEYEKSTATPKENEERYRALFNSSFELVYLHDLKGNFIDANPTAFKLLGYSKEELGSLNFLSLLDRGQIWKAMKTLNEIKKYGRQKEPTEFRLKMKNGMFIDVETTAEMVYRDGKPYAIQGIARGIAERKQAQQILKESIDKYRTLFETTPDLIVETDEKGILLAVNPAMAGHFGIPVEKLIGKNIFDILPKKVTEERAKIARKALKDDEIKINEDESAGRYFHNVYVPIIHPDGRKTLQLVARDITAAKEAEEEIRYLKHYNENILESNPNPILVIKGTQIEYVNKSLISTLGKTKNEYIMRSLKEVIPSEILPVFENLLQEDGRSIELKFGGKDFNVYSFVLKKAEEDEEEARWGMVFQDITERMKMEEKIKIFSNAIASAFDGFMLTDLKGNITYANEAAISAFGYTSEEFLKLNITELNADPMTAKKVMQDMAVKERWSGEVINIRKNKEKFPAILTAFIIKDDKKGNPIGTMRILRDITEHKRAEAKIKASEQKLQSVLASSPDPIFSTDLNGNITECNQATLDLIGVQSKEQLIGKSPFSMLIENQRGKITEQMRKCIGGDMIKDTEYTFIARNGRKIDSLVSASLLKDASGKPTGFMAVVKDITERKQVEEKLLESETLLNDVGEMAHVGGWELITETKAVHWTKETYRIHDVSIDEKFDLSKAVLFFDLPYRSSLEVALQRGMETGESFDLVLPFTSAKGRHLWTRATGRAVKDDSDKIVKLIGTFQDITKHKKTEDALRFNEDKLRKVIDSSPDNITVSDLNGTIIDCNQETADMHGFSKKEDIIGKNALELIAPKDHEKAMGNLKKTLELGLIKNVEYTFLKKDGSEFPAEISASVIRDFSGKPMSFIGVIKDISERKKAETMLQESEKKFKTITAIAKEGIIMIDPKGEVSYWNEAAEKIFGYTFEEILGKNLHVVLAPKRFYESYYRGFEKFKETGTGAAVGKTLELAGIKKDGTEFPLELSLSSVMIQNQWHAVGIARDITERKQNEEKLREKINDLEQYKKLTVDREFKMIELKKEINGLCKQLNQKPRYEEV